MFTFPICLYKQASGGVDPNAFIVTFQTTTSSESITLPFYNTGTYNCTVDWGDGSGTSAITTYNDPDRIHTYATAGTYTVTITGTMPGWSFYLVSTVSSTKIRTIQQWGSVGLVFLQEAFRNCTGLTSVAAGSLAGVTSLIRAFRNCSALTTVGALAIPNCTTLEGTLRDCSALTSFGGFTSTSGVLSCAETWYNCTNLPSIPSFDASAATTFTFACYFCSSLTSFPTLNYAACTTFNSAWYGCSALTSWSGTGTGLVSNYLDAWRTNTNLATFSISTMKAITNSTRIFSGATSLSQASVDSILATLYADRNLITWTTPSIDLSPGATPGGTYQDGDPPTTGQEYRYELVNDPESEGFYTWTITV